MFINMIAVIVTVIDVISIFIFCYILMANGENIDEMNSSFEIIKNICNFFYSIYRKISIGVL